MNTYHDLALPRDFTLGERVELHPCMDLWMQGARYGTVSKIGRTKVSVHVDKLSRVVRISARNLRSAED